MPGDHDAQGVSSQADGPGWAGATVASEIDENVVSATDEMPVMADGRFVSSAVKNRATTLATTVRDGAVV